MSRPPLQERVFDSLWRLVSRRPRTIIVVAVLLAAASAVAARLYLPLNSDQDQLISPELPFQKTNLQMLHNFGDQEYLFVVIHTGGTEEGKAQAVRYADRLAGRLRQHPELIKAIYYRLSAEDLGSGVLLYLPPEQARTVAANVKALAPSLARWYHDGSLSGFIDLTASLFTAGPGGGGTGREFLTPALDGLNNLLAQVEDGLAGKPVGGPLFNVSLGGIRYFFTGNGLFLIMRVLPEKNFRSMDVIGKPLAQVRQAMAATGAEFPGVTAGLTGRPVLQADEMQTTNRDMTKASVIAVVVIALLFIVVLHGWRRPLMIVVSMLLAIGWTFGFATVAIGELNLLSIVFTLVLVGIGVDFGVHLVSRAMEAARGGDPVGASIETALCTTGPGITLGCLTSMCAFYSVLGSDFVGLAELGAIGGTGLLFCLLATLVVLPALLLAVIRRHPPAGPRVITMNFLARVTSRPALLLLMMLTATLGCMPGLFGDHFDYNLLKLQAQGLESVQYERLLINSTKESTWYAVMVADSLDEVSRRRQELLKLPSVGRVETILDYLPQDQAEKMDLYAGAARALKGVPAAPVVAGTPRAAPLAAALEKLADALAALQEKLFAAGAGEEAAQVEKLLGHIDGALDTLAREPSRAAQLVDLQDRLRLEVDGMVRRLRTWLTAKPLTPETLPPALRDLFIGRDGRYQIKITPSANIWDFAKLQTFVGDLRQIDPQVTGTPVAVLESARLMRRVFLRAAALTVGLVSLLLWLSSRSLVYVVLALLPLGVGILWLLELMGLLGINFNLANFFAIPILIAIGVDGGVHFLARWRELGGEGNLFATSTPTAVTLSFSTTMIGFGGLLLAHHQGLASLGAVMVLGSLTCMLATLLVLPMVLKLLGSRWR